MRETIDLIMVILIASMGFLLIGLIFLISIAASLAPAILMYALAMKLLS